LIASIWVDPDNHDIIFAGSNSGGLFKTIDGGLNWYPLTDDILALGVESIVVNPFNKNKIYIATGVDNIILPNYYSFGVLKSQDGGLSWDTTGLNNDFFHNKAFTLGDMLNNPDRDSSLYLLVHRDKNDQRYTTLLKSADDGASWDSLYAQDGIVFNDMEFEPGSSHTLYLAGEKIYKIISDGNEIIDITPLLEIPASREIIRTEIAVSELNSNHLYVLCLSLDNNEINYLQLFKSTDNSSSFSEVHFQPYTQEQLKNIANISMMELKISNFDEDLIYTAGLYVHKFSISGSDATEIPVIQNYHTDVRDFLIIQGKDENEILYIGNDGGVSQSINEGDTFVDISRHGLTITQFYGFGTLEGHDLIMGGTQDGNNTIYRRNDKSWMYHDFDAYGGVMSDLKPATVYSVGAYSDVTIIKSTDNAFSFNPLGSYPSDTICLL
jgi:hypothetical protein